MKNKLKTLKIEIKAKIANGIWKFRTKFWNDSSKIYNGHMWYTHRFAHSKYANRVILCLYYIECELIAVFIKILFDN